MVNPDSAVDHPVFTTMDLAGPRPLGLEIQETPVSGHILKTSKFSNYGSLMLLPLGT